MIFLVVTLFLGSLALDHGVQGQEVYSSQQFGGRYSIEDFLEGTEGNKGPDSTTSDFQPQLRQPVKTGVKGHKIVQQWQPYPLWKLTESSSTFPSQGTTIISETQESSSSTLHTTVSTEQKFNTTNTTVINVVTENSQFSSSIENTYQTFTASTTESNNVHVNYHLEGSQHNKPSTLSSISPSTEDSTNHSSNVSLHENHTSESSVNINDESVFSQATENYHTNPTKETDSFQLSKTSNYGQEMHITQIRGQFPDPQSLLSSSHYSDITQSTTVTSQQSTKEVNLSSSESNTESSVQKVTSGQNLDLEKPQTAYYPSLKTDHEHLKINAEEKVELTSSNSQESHSLNNPKFNQNKVKENDNLQSNIHTIHYDITQLHKVTSHTGTKSTEQYDSRQQINTKEHTFPIEPSQKQYDIKEKLQHNNANTQHVQSATYHITENPIPDVPKYTTEINEEQFAGTLKPELSIHTQLRDINEAQQTHLMNPENKETSTSNSVTTNHNSQLTEESMTSTIPQTEVHEVFYSTVVTKLCERTKPVSLYPSNCSEATVTESSQHQSSTDNIKTYNNSHTDKKVQQVLENKHIAINDTGNSEDLDNQQQTSIDFLEEIKQIFIPIDSDTSGLTNEEEQRTVKIILSPREEKILEYEIGQEKQIISYEVTTENYKKKLTESSFQHSGQRKLDYGPFSIDEVKKTEFRELLNEEAAIVLPVGHQLEENISQISTRNHNEPISTEKHHIDLNETYISTAKPIINVVTEISVQWSNNHTTGENGSKQEEESSSIFSKAGKTITEYLSKPWDYVTKVFSRR